MHKQKNLPNQAAISLLDGTNVRRFLHSTQIVLR
jgi:hypothetical protein